MTSETKMRTITLTDRPPVKIQEDQWPEIAHGRYFDHDNQYEFQANRRWRADIRVRQHADGRMLTYGVYDYDTAFQSERGFLTKAGELLQPGADAIAAIRRVGETLTAAAIEAGHDDFAANISAAVRDCIGDLPSEQI